MKVNKSNTETFRIASIFEGWHLVNHQDLSVIHEKMSPNCEEKVHLHKKSRQFFFVLKGSIVCEVDGIEHTLNEMEGIEVPPLSQHKMINKTDQAAEFLTISQPHYRTDKDE